MKTILLLILLVASTVYSEEYLAVDPAMTLTLDYMYGVVAPNKEALIEYLKEAKLGCENEDYVLNITLKAGGEALSIRYKTYADIPEVDVPTTCPKSEDLKAGECYFIKYIDEKEVVK